MTSGKKGLIFLMMAAAGLCLARAGEQTSLRQVSAGGLTGWTQATHRHSSGEWMNSFLKVGTRAGDVREFRAQYAFIVGWGFARNDTCVVIQSQNAHGPYYWQLFDLSTGRPLDEYFRGKSEEAPLWARDFTAHEKPSR